MTVNELAMLCKTDESYCEQLWLAVYKLVRMWAKKYVRTNHNNNRYELDDLVQSAFFALPKAVRAYDISSGYKFTTYLNYHCRSQFQEVLGIRSSKREPKSISLNTVISGESSEFTIEDSLTCDSAAKSFEQAERRVYNLQLKSVIEKALQDLPNDEMRQLIKMRYYDELTLKEIGESLGVTTSRSRVKVNDALRKLSRGKHGKILKSFYYDVYALRGTSLTSFRYTFTSSVEAAAIKKIEFEEKQQIEQFELEIKAKIKELRNKPLEFEKWKEQFYSGVSV